MTYALQSLLRIRSVREERAETDLAKARRAVTAAEEALRAREEELAAFEETKEARRDRIFETVMNRVITMNVLEAVQEGVAQIDREGVLRADHVTLAKKELKEKEDAREASRLGYVEATKNRMKISEHRRFWEAEEHAKDEQRSELEMEDFTGKKNMENRDDS